MGMSIYDIDQNILALVDPETGEVADYEAFDSLMMERDQKVENIALWIKDLKAEAAAIREEEKNLAERRRAAENRAKRLTEYLATALNGEKFKSPRVAVSYRSSKSVTVMDGFVDWAMKNGDQYLRYSEPDPDKTAIKAALEAGETLPFAEITENTNVVIK